MNTFLALFSHHSGKSKFRLSSPTNHHSTLVQKINNDKIRCSLFSYDSEASSLYLEPIKFTSEVLFCKRLQDATPTDERSLSNPRGILQFKEEITSIQLQNWCCLQQGGSSWNSCGSSCACVRDHVIQLSKVLCQGLLDESWREVLMKIEELSEQDNVKGIDAYMYYNGFKIVSYVHKGWFTQDNKFKTVQVY